MKSQNRLALSIEIAKPTSSKHIDLLLDIVAKEGKLWPIFNFQFFHRFAFLLSKPTRSLLLSAFAFIKVVCYLDLIESLELLYSLKCR